MNINDIEFNCSLEEVLNELIAQLKLNGIDYIRKLKPSGKSIQICCPYHKNGMERKPSAGIRKSDGMFHCFACGETHTLPEVISYCFGHTDDMIGKFGWSWLLKNFATIAVEERKDVDLDFYRDTMPVHNVDIRNTSDSNGNRYVSEKELDKYRYYHPYWKKRGIVDENIIELFDLGYDQDSKCITFPVRDINGNCLFVAKRSVQTKFFHYPQGVEKPLYGLYELYQLSKLHHGHFENEIIVCESMIDALTCWQYGKCAAAFNGLGTGLQFKQLRELPCRKLILATDNDEAGLKARARIRKNVPNKIITEYILPEGRKDINELSKEEFLSLLEIF